MLDNRISQLLTVCQNKSEGTSRESPSSIDNVMTIVRALPGVDSKYYLLLLLLLLLFSKYMK